MWLHAAMTSGDSTRPSTLVVTLRPGCKVKGLPNSELGVVVVHLVNVGSCPLGQELLEGFAIECDLASGLQAGRGDAFQALDVATLQAG